MGDASEISLEGGYKPWVGCSKWAPSGFKAVARIMVGEEHLAERSDAGSHFS